MAGVQIQVQERKSSRQATSENSQRPWLRDNSGKTMEIGFILSAETLQGQVVRDLLLKLPKDTWQEMREDSVVFYKEIGWGVAYIMVDRDGVVTTWFQEVMPPAIIDPSKKMPEPKTAKGNNPKQIIQNTIRLHSENIKLLSGY